MSVDQRIPSRHNRMTQSCFDVLMSIVYEADPALKMQYRDNACLRDCANVHATTIAGSLA